MLQHKEESKDYNVIMQIYRRSLEGYDIVSASPSVNEKISSKMFYKMFERFSDKSGKMCTESFRILSRRVINRISATSKSILYRKALYANCGLKTDNIKYSVTGREVLKIDKREKKYRSALAVDSLILYTGFGYRFSMTMTFLMMVISLGVIAYTVITYFMADPVEGWTTTILFISFCFFGLFGILTIIIKYLQLIINMVFRRKHYSY